MKKHDIYDRVFQFACRVLKMDRAFAKDRRINRNVVNQLVRASSGIGSNLEEARAGQSRADFHARLRISLNEARESHYWLRLLAESESVTPRRIRPLIEEASEIVAILTSIAKKTNPRNPSHGPSGQ